MRYLAALLASTCFFLATPLAHANTEAPSSLDETLPAVVNLSVEYYGLKAAPSAGRSNPAEEDGKISLGMGSGVIIDAKEGYIVTNAHVVNQSSRIIVTLSDGRRYIGKLLGVDADSDLAAIQIKADHLTSVHLGNSTDLQVGSQVIAIGNPFGLNHTVTSGIVSGKHRKLGMIGIENFIQTDAPINPGNSGGALFDQQGNLVGINSAILATTGGNIGIGFAIPVELVKPVIAQLIQYGRSEHGRLGVILQDLTPNLAESFNHPELANHAVLVSDVMNHSPAKTAGFKSGDIITQLDELNTEKPNQISSMISANRAGTSFQFKVIRQQTQLDLSAKTASNAELSKAMAIDTRLSGLEVANYDAMNNQGEHVRGVIVTRIKDGSNAWLSGLAIMDVILEANSTKTDNPSSFITAINQKQSPLLLKVLRGGHVIYLSASVSSDHS